MLYIIKSGALLNPENEEKLAQVKSIRWGARKIISLSESSETYQTDIDSSETPSEKRGDVRYHIYKLTDQSGNMLMEAQPGYARDNDPDILGWPVCRMPKVDHADIRINHTAFLLVMHNNQNYVLMNKDGTPLLQIMHRGISGGWTIETKKAFTAQVLCGLFIFCRYIEQENEFIIV